MDRGIRNLDPGGTERKIIVKRMIDIVGASFALFLLSPLLLALAVLIRQNMGSPILFRQARPGLHGKSFEMIKFRSMRDTIGPDGMPLPDGDRITTLGKKLRSTSLDELPSLWNVIKGDLSLVGPRPLLMEYLPLYSSEQARRHTVRPGITGWAQINGRNAISWEQKFALDTWYVDNRSIWLDFRIMWMTVHRIIIRDGISAEGEATMPKFRG